jgi:hypothetical protein
MRFGQREATTAVLAIVVVLWSAVMANAAASSRGTQPGSRLGDLAERAGEHTVSDVKAFMPDRAWFVGGHGGGLFSETFRQWDGETWVKGRTAHVPEATLNGVDGLSDADAWAVGIYVPRGGQYHRALVEHWDGARWTLARTRHPVGRGYFGVAEVAPDDVWAVGERNVGVGGDATLAEHWDGSRWHVVATPNLQGNDLNYLKDVVALGPDDVWALGATFTSETTAYAEHWDGRTWSFVPLPNPKARLDAIDGVASDDVWIVGNGTSGAVTDHWDGHQWTVVPAANPPGRNGVLHAVTVIDRNDAWAVGEAYNKAPIETLIEHWDGTTWSIVDSPSIGAYLNGLYAVDADGPNDVWAIGLFSDDSDSYHQKLVALHWDGSAWTRARMNPR